MDSHAFLRGCVQAVFIRQVEFLAKLLQAQLGRQTGSIRILDWGCGKGHTTYLLQKKGFDVLACDLAADTRDSAFGQQAPILYDAGIEVIPLLDPVQLPFESESFDCVTSFGVLEHVADDAGSMREVRRVLKPGGVFYVTFLPCFLSWTQALARLRGNSYHDRLYERRTFERLAVESGFKVDALWFAQLFPKRAITYHWDTILEPLDRVLCRFTPLKYFATNLEIVLRAG